MKVSRRHVLFSAPGLASAAAFAPAAPYSPSLLKLSLAAYSFRDYLDLKPAKPIAEPMTLFAFADLAASLGLGAIEPTGYYFAETAPAYLQKFKRHCTRLGLDISGTATGNDFCQAGPGRAKDIAKVKTWIEIAGFLGAKTLRVFAGNTPKDDSEANARSRCVETLHEVCEHGAKHGVIVAVENHGGITATPEPLLAIVRAVRHDWLGVNLDTANFRTADPYADVAKVAPEAVTVQLKTDIHPNGKTEPADLPRLLGILRNAGYRGYVALEFEGSENAKSAVPRHVRTLQRLLAG